MLVLPFALMAVLGGFIPSSVVALWAFFAPIGALAFATPREALRWVVASFLLVVAVGVFGGALRTANNLPAGLVHGMFIVNIAGVSIVTFVVLYAFVRERDRALAAVQRLFGQYLSPQIVRSLLSDPRRVALGDAVNLAARLQTGAKAGEVVVSAPTYALIRDLSSVRRLGRFAVKGKSEEVEAYVLDRVTDL